MAEHGGFEHNRHALRIVEVLEYRYPGFPGLNLSWEVLEAMALHSPRRGAADLAEFTAAGPPPLEAPGAAAADSLAYDAPALDDAVSIGVLPPDEVQDVRMWGRALEAARRRSGVLGPLQLQPRVGRGLIDWQVRDLLDHPRQRLHEERIGSVADVRA